MTTELLPTPVARIVHRKIDSGEFYSFAEIPRPGQEPVWQRFDALTPANLEALVDHHGRQARQALERFAATGSSKRAERAADHVFRANRYALRRCELLAVEPTPFDLPFPILPDGEVAVPKGGGR